MLKFNKKNQLYIFIIIFFISISNYLYFNKIKVLKKQKITVSYDLSFNERDQDFRKYILLSKLEQINTNFDQNFFLQLIFEAEKKLKKKYENDFKLFLQRNNDNSYKVNIKNIKEKKIEDLDRFVKDTQTIITSNFRQSLDNEISTLNDILILLEKDNNLKVVNELRKIQLRLNEKKLITFGKLKKKINPSNYDRINILNISIAALFFSLFVIVCIEIIFYNSKKLKFIRIKK